MISLAAAAAMALFVLQATTAEAHNGRGQNGRVSTAVMKKAMPQSGAKVAPVRGNRKFGQGSIDPGYGVAGNSPVTHGPIWGGNPPRANSGGFTITHGGNPPRGSSGGFTITHGGNPPRAPTTNGCHHDCYHHDHCHGDVCHHDNHRGDRDCDRHDANCFGCDQGTFFADLCQGDCRNDGCHGECAW